MKENASQAAHLLHSFSSKRMKTVKVIKKLSLSYLDELSVAGECAVEYLGLYQKLIKPTHWKIYLAARGVLPYIGNLITKVLF